jgi:adenosylhomocysteine nucleosidase
VIAFPPEWEALAPHLTETSTHAVAGRTILTGMLEGHPVLLAQSGIGMVNAAMTAQALVDRFAATRLVMSGISGGADPALGIGDVVIPARWGHFLEVAMGRAQPGGFGNPVLPGATDLPGFGMMHPRDVLVGNAVEPVVERRWFAADPALLALAEATLAGLALPGHAALGRSPRLHVGGHGVSGSAFVDNADYRRYLHATFAARVIDMESAAVAQVAYANRVPFLGIRSVSDLAGGDEGANVMASFMAIAATHAATVVRRLVAALPA